MAGRKLATGVYIDGIYHEPGSTPDKEIAAKITNPKAWGNEPDTGADVDAEAKAAAAAAKAEADAKAKADAERGYPEGDPVEDWKGAELDAYAKAKNIDLAGASNKADKVAAIQKAATGA